MYRYRIYFAPAGSDLEFLGEFRTLESAIKKANSASCRLTVGLPASDWETARAAGQVAGMTAPDIRGEEEEEPIEWIGDFCIVRTSY